MSRLGRTGLVRAVSVILNCAGVPYGHIRGWSRSSRPMRGAPTKLWVFSRYRCLLPGKSGAREWCNGRPVRPGKFGYFGMQVTDFLVQVGSGSALSVNFVELISCWLCISSLGGHDGPRSIRSQPLRGLARLSRCRAFGPA